MKRLGMLVILVLLFCAEFQMIHAFPGGKKDMSEKETNEDSHEVSLEDSHEVSLEDSHEVSLEDSHEVSLEDSHEVSLEDSHEVSLEDSHEESAQKDTSRNKRSFEETSSEKSSEESSETSRESSPKISTEIPFDTFFCGEKPDIYTGPCAYCECIGYDWECYMGDCGEVQCVDGYRPEGECCVECPNGPNCLYNDRIISVGESFFNDDGESCTCQETDIWTGAPEVQCA
ncbi:von Willebrand factor C domain-containing protein 2 [Biomphalaria pfeifferi]|uniref:von Willebrand factor C domain-containing protein 2 n=1 Tax=Biomphalaria pfeifferi TaxID=112525 RepID=A0AAD8C9L3_BIOPF|nr:von Willebrand factor C domain-containing protein 2 [Biomphalaria pfeifferi]